MKDLERNQLNTLTSVRDFGTQQAALFPPAQLAGELMTTISGVVDELSGLAAVQTASINTGRQDTEGRAAARAALRQDMEAINRTAHAMAVRTPGIDTKFRLTRGNDQQLLALARAFVSEATPLKSEFLRYGMAADFLDDLTADIGAFGQLVASRQRSVEARTASTAGIDDALERGMDALKELDGILRNVLRDDVQTLAAWITASHVERPPRKRQPSKPSQPPPSSPAAPAP